MLEVTDYKTAVEVLKNPLMVQALYEKSPVIMADVLLTLEGDEHLQRRQVEYRVFDRYFLRDYEQQVFPQVFAPILQHATKAGQIDLVEMVYRVVMNLTADFAGIDRQGDSVTETDMLVKLIKAFSAAATIEHSTLDREAINSEAVSNLQLLEMKFLRPSIQRRQAIIEAGAELPNDVLSAHLQADPPLPADVLLREIAFYLQAGAHSTANSTVHAMHEILTWCQGSNGRRSILLNDRALLQRCVHESLRLHPASPVSLRRASQPAEIGGRSLVGGDLVAVNLEKANRDPLVFGADAVEFIPERPLPRSVRPYGLSFGHGIHACLGRDLDGGVVPKQSVVGTEVQMGIVGSMIEDLLKNGAKWVANSPPEPDPGTTRNNFSVYPIALEARV